MKPNFVFAPFLALLGVVSIAPAASAANFVVTPPFKIQQAIDAALASGDKADFIFVNAGIYSEALTIDFSASPNGQELLYLVHNQSVRPIVTGGVRILNSRLVTLDGFELRSDTADSQAAARVDDTVGAAFVQCVFPAGDFGGIDAQDSFEVIVNACQFGAMNEDGSSQGGFGVRIRGKASHKIQDSKFAADEGRSIWVEADRTEIRSNTLKGASGDGALFADGIANLIKNNTIKNADSDGMRIGGTAEISDCKVSGCGGVGIRYGIDDTASFSGGVIKNCDVFDNDSHGIFVNLGEDGVEVRGCDLDENGSAGIRVRSDRCVLRDNDVTSTNSGGSGGHGIQIDSPSEGNTIRSNTFKSNSGQGIVVDGDDTYVLLNTASDSDSFVDNGSGNEGRDNKTKGVNQFD